MSGLFGGGEKIDTSANDEAKRLAQEDRDKLKAEKDARKRARGGGPGSRSNLAFKGSLIGVAGDEANRAQIS